MEYEKDLECVEWLLSRYELNFGESLTELKKLVEAQRDFVIDLEEAEKAHELWPSWKRDLIGLWD